MEEKRSKMNTGKAHGLQAVAVTKNNTYTGSLFIPLVIRKGESCGNIELSDKKAHLYVHALKAHKAVRGVL